MIYTVTLNPARDRTIIIPDFRVDALNRVIESRDDPGGKGVNVSKVIKSLGGESVAMGILGGAAGKYIRKCLTDAHIENDFVQTAAETRTNIKVIDPNAHTTTDINDPGAPVTRRVLTSVFAKLTARVARGDIVVLAGKTPSGVSRDLIGVWTGKLSALGARVFLDADSGTLAEGVKAAPYLIKPNEAELAQLLGARMFTLRDIAEAGKRVIREAGVKFVAVSMGADGALFVTPDITYRGEGLRVQVNSTVGAGDAMMAALAFAHERAMPLADACRLALATSAANVMCAGTQSASRADIDKLLAQTRVSVYR